LPLSAVAKHPDAVAKHPDAVAKCPHAETKHPDAEVQLPQPLPVIACKVSKKRAQNKIFTEKFINPAL